METRKWLRANGYDDVADMIDEAINEWRAAGKRTRRNWWDVLAGRANGQPCIYAGRTFPILRAALIRKGRPVTPDALCRNPDEVVPDIRVTGRWPQQTEDQPVDLVLDHS